jgi:AcrR family transcriptional regulator
LLSKIASECSSIDAVAEAAGVAKGTFYLYFATKDDVVAALVDRYAERYGQALREAVADRPTEDWAGKLAAWVTTAVERLLDGGELAEAVFHQHPQPASNVFERAGAAPLAELLADGNAAGAWQVSDSRTVATFVFAGLHGGGCWSDEARMPRPTAEASRRSGW